MRIAQVAPLTESLPPHGYGGIERVVHNLTEELVRQGHDVTLFASGDSLTSADHVAVVDESLRLSTSMRDHVICHTLQLAEVVRLAPKFDIVHFHTDFGYFPVWRNVRTPQVLTLHGRLDLPDLSELFIEFNEISVVSISDSQRRPLPEANWVGTVYNGVPTDPLHFRAEAGDYLAFLGRISPEKNPEAAIEIAKRVGIPLKIAAKVDRVDEEFFEVRVKPLLDDPLIEFIGEVNDAEKYKLLGGAKALLFPIDWEEPFGLVMAESMACGTPVVAFERGSVSEVMRDGVTGFVVRTVDEAVGAIDRIDEIDRAACRKHCKDNFSIPRMAERYLDVYAKLTETRRASQIYRRWPSVDPPAGVIDAGMSENGSATVNHSPSSSAALQGRPLL